MYSLLGVDSSKSSKAPVCIRYVKNGDINFHIMYSDLEEIIYKQTDREHNGI